MFCAQRYAVCAFAVDPAGDSGRFPVNIDDKKKRVTEISVTLACGLVPRAGLEPAQLLPLPPQDSVSTSSTTSAAKRIINVFSCSRQVFFSPAVGGGCGRASYRETCGQGAACMSPFFSSSPVKARWGRDGGLGGRGTPPAQAEGFPFPLDAFPRPHGAAWRAGLALARAYAYINAT